MSSWVQQYLLRYLLLCPLQIEPLQVDKKISSSDIFLHINTLCIQQLAPMALQQVPKWSLKFMQTYMKYMSNRALRTMLISTRVHITSLSVLIILSLSSKYSINVYRTVYKYLHSIYNITLLFYFNFGSIYNTFSYFHLFLLQGQTWISGFL